MQGSSDSGRVPSEKAALASCGGSLKSGEVCIELENARTGTANEMNMKMKALVEALVDVDTPFFTLRTHQRCTRNG